MRSDLPVGGSHPHPTHTVRCTRTAGRWKVEVPLVGEVLEVRRLDQARAAATKLLAAHLHLPLDAVVVVLDADLEPTTAAAVAEARARAVTAQEAVEALGLANRHAVRLLLADGLVLRDAAALMHLSPQRIHQLSPGGRP